MSKDIFIPYSRRDQEFVTRLASNLNVQVVGVWFDQSAIQFLGIISIVCGNSD